MGHSSKNIFILPLFLLILSSSFRVMGSEEEVDALAEGLAPLAIVPQPISNTHKMLPGFFYRQSEADVEKEVEGVYAKSATYYDENLFVDDPDLSMKDLVFSKPKADQNWMGVLFFGIWSVSDICQNPIVIPVRGLKDGHMTYVNEAGGRKYRYRCVWKTGHEEEDAKKIDGYAVRKLPCKGSHTETVFLEYIKEEATQKALWEYFIHKTNKSDIPAEGRVLDCIGFTIYSFLDACDSCMRGLLDLKKSRLSHLVPDDVSTVCTPLPFYITYQSRVPYRPEHPYETSFSNATVFRASMLFIPPPALLRLSKPDEDHDGEFFEAVSTDDFSQIKHQIIEFEEKENPTYIILKLNEGASVRVKRG